MGWLALAWKGIKVAAPVATEVLRRTSIPIKLEEEKINAAMTRALGDHPVIKGIDLRFNLGTIYIGATAQTKFGLITLGVCTVPNKVLLNQSGQRIELSRANDPVITGATISGRLVAGVLNFLTSWRLFDPISRLCRGVPGISFNGPTIYLDLNQMGVIAAAEAALKDRSTFLAEVAKAAVSYCSIVGVSSQPGYLTAKVRILQS